MSSILQESAIEVFLVHLVEKKNRLGLGKIKLGLIFTFLSTKGWFKVSYEFIEIFWVFCKCFQVEMSLVRSKSWNPIFWAPEMVGIQPVDDTSSTIASNT